MNKSVGERERRLVEEVGNVGFCEIEYEMEERFCDATMCAIGDICLVETGGVKDLGIVSNASDCREAAESDGECKKAERIPCLV